MIIDDIGNGLGIGSRAGSATVNVVVDASEFVSDSIGYIGTTKPKQKFSKLEVKADFELITQC